MNDTGLVIPMAIQAGLGEYARNQLLITPEFGPRLRFSKIFTDMPLKSDKPRRPGVAKFCDICTKCVDACPVKALPSGGPKDRWRSVLHNKVSGNGHQMLRNASHFGQH